VASSRGYPDADRSLFVAGQARDNGAAPRTESRARRPDTPFTPNARIEADSPDMKAPNVIAHQTREGRSAHSSAAMPSSSSRLERKSRARLLHRRRRSLSALPERIISCKPCRCRTVAPSSARRSRLSGDQVLRAGPCGVLHEELDGTEEYGTASRSCSPGIVVVRVRASAIDTRHDRGRVTAILRDEVGLGEGA